MTMRNIIDRSPVTLKRARKILCALMALLIAAALMPWGGMRARAEGVTCTLSEDGTLTVSGSGQVRSADVINAIGGSENRSLIKKVVVEEGITVLGLSAFSDCDNLTEAHLPDSLTEIWQYAFSRCGSLATVNIPNNVNRILAEAFEFCDSLTDITIPASMTRIRDDAFYTSSGSAHKNITFLCDNLSDYAPTNYRFYSSVTMTVYRGFELNGTEITQENRGIFSDTYHFQEHNQYITLITRYKRDVPAEGPTCTEKGHIAYHLGANDKKYSMDEDEHLLTDDELYTDDALGHTFGDWNVTAQPTCTEEGERTRTCSVCQKVETETVPALGHDDPLEHTAAKDATCTAEGNTEYWKCTKCGTYFGDAEGGTVINQADTVIGMTAHTLSHIAEKKADCENSGTKEHWKCSVCARLFADAEGKSGIGSDMLVTAPLGHDWNDSELTEKPSAKEPGEITYTCGRDSSHTKTKEIPAGTDYIKVPDSTYRLGSKKDVVFEITCDDAEIDAYLIDFFEGVKLDGKELKADTDYTYEKGSVKVTLKSSYIEKNITSNGKYKVEAIFSSGTAKGTLKVSSGSGDTPGTHDDMSDPAIVGAALSFVLALVYIAYSVVAARRDRESENA